MKRKARQKYEGRIKKDIQADGNRVGDISLSFNNVLEQPRKGKKINPKLALRAIWHWKLNQMLHTKTP